MLHETLKRFILFLPMQQIINAKTVKNHYFAYASWGTKSDTYKWIDAPKDWYANGFKVLVPHWMWTSKQTTDLEQYSDSPKTIPLDLWEHYLAIYRQHKKVVINVLEEKHDLFEIEELEEDLLDFANKFGWSFFMYGQGVHTWASDKWKNTCPPSLRNICLDMYELNYASEYYKQHQELTSTALEILNNTQTKSQFNEKGNATITTFGTHACIWLTWFNDCNANNVKRCSQCTTFFRAKRKEADCCSSTCRVKKHKRQKGGVV